MSPGVAHAVGRSAEHVLWLGPTPQHPRTHARTVIVRARLAVVQGMPLLHAPCRPGPRIKLRATV